MGLLSELLSSSNALFSSLLRIFGVWKALREQILPQMLGKGVGNLVFLLLLCAVTGTSFSNQQGQLGDVAIFFEGIRIFIKTEADVSDED